MRGVPGVQPDRLAEAYTVKHCALSLVGEPIMYPRINELLRELHEREISTFLVTNAQFPECIRSLDPVTQLYVSIDAASKEVLTFNISKRKRQFFHISFLFCRLSRRSTARCSRTFGSGT